MQQEYHKLLDSVEILPLCGPPEVQKLRNKFRIRKLKWSTCQKITNNYYYPPEKLTPYRFTPKKHISSKYVQLIIKPIIKKEEKTINYKGVYGSSTNGISSSSVGKDSKRHVFALEEVVKPSTNRVVPNRSYAEVAATPVDLDLLQRLETYRMLRQQIQNKSKQNGRHRRPKKDRYKQYKFAPTENKSYAHHNTGSECLDFFYQVMPGTNRQKIYKLLDAAWPSDKNLCLKLIFQLGATRKGKSDRFSFYHAIYWLYKNHPATFLYNLHVVEKAVYFKALIEILAYIVEEEKKGLYIKRQRAIEKKIAAGGKIGVKIWTRKKGRGTKHHYPLDTIIFSKKPKVQEVISKKLDLPKQQREPQTVSVLKKYDKNSVFRTAHNLICQHFAENLEKDLDNFNQGKSQCSLAAKWVPNLNSGYENRTLVSEGIARRLFPKSLPEYVNLNEQFYSYRIRDRLRKEYLVPLRKHLKIPEVFMSQNKWSEIDYTRVPSVCMRLRKNQFLKHDGDRLKAFLEEVKKGQKKIASKVLQPHEILRDLNNPENSEESQQISELQWGALIQNIQKEFKKNQLTNCVAVCDVSRSMEWHTTSGVSFMEVAIALTLIISEVTQEPWKNHAITFSASPKFKKISGTTLKERYQSLKKFNQGQNTDFQKVFEEILQLAQQCSLPPQQMVKTVFVFSDMQFDQAAGKPWRTSHQILKKKFSDANYPMPNIVYWNLRLTDNFPVKKDKFGTRLLSGFSANLLKLLVEGKRDKKTEDFTPMDVMIEAVSAQLFQQLKVVD